MSFLSMANGLNSTVTLCRANGGECVGDIILSLMLFMLIAGWFGVICFLGYSAQERRSSLLAKLLMVAELATILAASINAKGHTDVLSLATSLIDIALAIWVITLAFRLMRSKGKRVVSHQRTRRRQARTK